MVICWCMKVTGDKKYKRALSRASIERMRQGGQNGSIEDKRRAGKAGWRAMVKRAAIAP